MKYTKEDWKASHPLNDVTNIITPERLLARVQWGASVEVEEQKANANLIVASPLMYEALYDAWEMLSYWVANFEDDEHKVLCAETRNKVEVIRQALTKAEGKEVKA